MTHVAIMKWALLRLSRGDTTDDLALDAAGYSVVNNSEAMREIAEAAIRGDEAKVTERVPSGLSRENCVSICAE